MFVTQMLIGRVNLNLFLVQIIRVKHGFKMGDVVVFVGVTIAVIRDFAIHIAIVVA